MVRSGRVGLTLDFSQVVRRIAMAATPQKRMTGIFVYLTLFLTPAANKSPQNQGYIPLRNQASTNSGVIAVLMVVGRVFKGVRKRVGDGFG